MASIMSQSFLTDCNDDYGRTLNGSITHNGDQIRRCLFARIYATINISCALIKSVNLSFAINTRNENRRITDFLNTTPNLSTRLQNVLAEYHNIYGNIFIKDVVKRNFLRVRDGGNKSWEELEKARNENS